MPPRAFRDKTAWDVGAILRAAAVAPSSFVDKGDDTYGVGNITSGFLFTDKADIVHNVCLMSEQTLRHKLTLGPSRAFHGPGWGMLPGIPFYLA